MLVLRKKSSFVGGLDGSVLLPEVLKNRTQETVRDMPLPTDQGTLAIADVFLVDHCDTGDEDTLLIQGDCSNIQNLGLQMQSGTLCILGDVGHQTAQGMTGGRLVIAGNTGDHLGAGMQDGLIYVVGNCGHHLGAPLPGQKSGLRGGDILIAGNVGDRACERMRRGTVFVGGNMGTYAASQMIAGSLIVAGEIEDHWGAGMRRGSIIFFRDYTGEPIAALSSARDFELSFLPILWKHLEHIQNEAVEILQDGINRTSQWTRESTASSPTLIGIPKTRWVSRQIADLNYQGRGEVLVLRRISSPQVSSIH